MVIVFEDNEAVVIMTLKANSVASRHVVRPHHVVRDWLSNKKQVGDILTHGFSNTCSLPVLRGLRSFYESSQEGNHAWAQGENVAEVGAPSRSVVFCSRRPTGNMRAVEFRDIDGFAAICAQETEHRATQHIVFLPPKLPTFPSRMGGAEASAAAQSVVEAPAVHSRGGNPMQQTILPSVADELWALGPSPAQNTVEQIHVAFT